MARKALRILSWAAVAALCLGMAWAAGWYASKQRYAKRTYYDLIGVADSIRFNPDLTERYRADLERLDQPAAGEAGGKPNYWRWIDNYPGAAALMEAARSAPFRAYECEVTLTNLSEKGYHHGGFGIISPEVPVFVNDNFFSDPENHVFAGKSHPGTLQVLVPTEGMADSEIRDLFQNVYITASFMVDGPDSVCHAAFRSGDAALIE